MRKNIVQAEFEVKQNGELARTVSTVYSILYRRQESRRWRRAARTDREKNI